MSHGRTLFAVGEASSNYRSTKYLAQAFYPGETAAIVNLSSEDCFADLNQSGLDKIVFLAHGSISTFGGYTAEKFAELFNERYVRSCPKTSKNEVKDVYLIGCDIGFVNDETQTSVSQEIANELFDRGFTNINIHSIAKPDNSIGDVLYVEVLSCSGAAGLASYASALAHHQVGNKHDVQTGFLKAYLLSQNDADRLAELEKNRIKNIKEIVDIQHKKSFLLINHAHPEVELNKPHNTFYPNEASLQRQERILKETARQFSRHQAEAIALLIKQRDHLAKKSLVKLKMMAMRLDFLIVQVQLANEHHWPNVVKEYARYLSQNPIYAAFFNKDSNTYKLLSALSKSDFKTANAVIAAHDNKKQVKKQNRFTHLFTSRRIQEQESTSAASLAKLPIDVTGKINRLALDLRGEIRNLRSSCFSFFYKYEVDTKRAKLELMNALLNSNSLSDAREIANEAIKVPRVMRSIRHARTKNILNEIISLKSTEQLLNEFVLIAPAEKIEKK